MKEKVKVGLLLTLALIMCLVIQFFSHYVFDFLILFFSVMAVIEFRKLTMKTGYPAFKWVPEISSGLVFLVLLISVLCKANATTIILLELLLVALIYLFVFLGARFIFTKDLQEDKFRQVTNMNINGFAFFKTNNTLATVLYPTMFMFFMYLINHVQELGLLSFDKHTVGAPLGFFGLILLFAICCLTDTFAMLFGSLIKGKKLCPKISPNKTISGACFGLVGGMAGALIVYFIFNAIYPDVFQIVHFWQFLIVGLVGSVVSQAGDLFESYLKRRANVKDAGDFFRSHGGVLDRFDSIIFNAPLIFGCLLFMFS